MKPDLPFFPPVLLCGLAFLQAESISANLLKYGLAAGRNSNRALLALLAMKSSNH